MDRTLALWVKRGFAVVQTDYAGLGTTGTHGYLIGVAEARAAADSVLAARELVGSLRREWVDAGHSQGGQAALFTSAVGQAWAPSLHLLGVAALAPPSQTSVTIPTLARYDAFDASFFPAIIRGAETAADIHTRQVLTPKAWEMLPQADDRCIAQLRSPASWGGMKSNEVFRPDADLTAFNRVLQANDSANLDPATPVLLAQGGQDEQVQHYWTETLYAQYLAKGVDVTLHVYPQADHRGAVSASFPDVASWVEALFSRG
jgi:fermentation-respiration switch protein FrsA (DUF1100 family)